MAKKKKKAGGKRRVGASRGSKDSPLMFFVGLIAGGLGTVLLDSKLLASVNGKIKGGGEMAIGGYGVYKMKNPLIKGVAAGMFTWGGIRLVTSLTGMTISGVGCRDNISGFSNVASIGNNGVKTFPSPSAVGSNRRERISTMAAGAGM
jgi:hypothetical protein